MAARSDSRARRNVAVLITAQALLGAQLPMIFTIGGLAGLKLAPNPCLATLPISATVLGSMLSANPLAAVMQRYGRRVGFWVGCGAGALGAVLAVIGLARESFTVFLLGALLTGTYQSAQGFYRFAAADAASEAFRPRAISWVMAGGLLSALIGPQATKITAGFSEVPYLGAYLFVVALNVLGAFLFLALDSPRPAPVQAHEPQGRTRRQLWADPTIRVAIIVAMVSYSLMNLVMTSAPLAMIGCGFNEGQAADAVSMHVLAMFFPSFFTGALISRFGTERVMAVGLAILMGAGLAGLGGVALGNFFAGMVLLGMGWNFGFIGATALLAGAHAPEERGRVQGMNDAIVFGCVTVSSLLSGGLTNCAGGSPQLGWMVVNLAMLPFLTLAGGALIWLWLRPGRGRLA